MLIVVFLTRTCEQRKIIYETGNTNCPTLASSVNAIQVSVNSIRATREQWRATKITKIPRVTDEDFLMLSRCIAKSVCSPRCEVTFLIDRNIPSGCREHDSVVLAWYVSCNLANQQASARRSRLLHVGELISGISNVVNSDSVLPGTRSRFT